jgi:hypothetical protein
MKASTDLVVTQAQAKYKQDVGVLHFAYWIATGQHKKGPIVSSHSIKGSHINSHVRQFMEKLQPFFQLVSNLFRSLAPAEYQYYRQEMDRLANTHADLATYLHESACPFLGMALVRNLRVTPHVDQGDVPEGYVLMTNVGSHIQSHLVLGTPDLQYKLAYLPGDIVLFRSGVIIHGVANNADNRTALVLFSHDNTLKWKD